MINLWLIVKILYLILLVIYCGFAFMVVRQIGLMTEVLGTNLSPALKAAARFHLVFALALTALAALVL